MRFIVDECGYISPQDYLDFELKDRQEPTKPMEHLANSENGIRLGGDYAVAA